MELAGGHRALAVLGVQHDRCRQRRHHRREVFRGVRLAQRPPDRPPVAHDRVGDHPLGLTEDRVVLVGDSGFEQLAMPGHGADADLVALDTHIGEVEIVDVDQVLGSGESQLHHRQQAVPPGNEPGLRAQPIQQRDGVVDAGRALVLERRWNLHEIPRSSFRPLVQAPKTRHKTRPAAGPGGDVGRWPGLRQRCPNRRVISTRHGDRDGPTVRRQ